MVLTKYIIYKILTTSIVLSFTTFTLINTKQNKRNVIINLSFYLFVFILQIFFKNKILIIIEIINILLLIYCSLKRLTNEIYLDELTQISNRKILKKLNNKIKLNNTCLILYDADKFKSINDTYGHAVGDQILVDIANILKSNVKNKKNIIRFGGDEFLIFYKFKDKKEIKDLINQINKSINAFNSTSKIKISLSNGYEVIHEKEDFNNFIEKLDQHLYETKKKKSHS